METNTAILMQSLKKSGVSSASDAFVEILHDCKAKGLESSPRGQKVRELFLNTTVINPLFPLPDLPGRRFNWKYFAGELAWYMKRDRRIDYINNFSNFWKGIADENGTINSNYGCLLIGEQLAWSYRALVQDVNSRQAISFVSRPQFQYPGNKDFVCTVYLNFWIREDELHMKVNVLKTSLFEDETL